ncbi:MAG: LamB/YcsF family protein [Actinomycetota bacterium]|nr:LamB/YcsF family protein [Actinomycetota bacterium]
MTVRVDLNADLGEGFGIWRLTDDEALLDVVTSANVACGFHAGDPTTMRRICALAAERAVRVGAQVGYRDLVGFGRRNLDVHPEDLAADVVYQIGALAACATAEGTRVRYVKPHGALYNRTYHDAVQAAAVVDAVVSVDPTLPVLGPPGSKLLELAEQAGLTVVAEGFADRAYTAAGPLVPRGTPGAVLTETATVTARALRMTLEATVEAADGTVVSLPVRSLCVHGDTPDAARLAHRIHAALEQAGVRVEAFA